MRLRNRNSDGAEPGPQVFVCRLSLPVAFIFARGEGKPRRGPPFVVGGGRGPGSRARPSDLVVKVEAVFGDEVAADGLPVRVVFVAFEALQALEGLVPPSGKQVGHGWRVVLGPEEAQELILQAFLGGRQEAAILRVFEFCDELRADAGFFGQLFTGDPGPDAQRVQDFGQLRAAYFDALPGLV